MDDDRPRRAWLTPIGDELTRGPAIPGRESLRDRLRSRIPHLQPATTRRRAFAYGGLRLAIVTVIATGVAVGVARAVGRQTSFGLYCVGAVILGAAFFDSAAPFGGRNPWVRDDRERRVSFSFAVMGAGAVVMGLAMLFDSLGV